MRALFKIGGRDFGRLRLAPARVSHQRKWQSTLPKKYTLLHFITLLARRVPAYRRGSRPQEGPKAWSGLLLADQPESIFSSGQAGVGQREGVFVKGAKTRKRQ
jgi:hypothetical protein